MGLTFFLFGGKMINIVLFGSFLWVLLTCYLFLLKGELLCDSKYYWGGRFRLSRN